MARDFSKPFYHTKAWLHNRSAYMNTYVDTDGHVVTPSSDGEFYRTDEYGYKTKVAEENVVPPRMCERCFSLGRIKAAKVIHHIIWLDPSNINDPKITLGYDNFMRLCQDCHAAVHAGQEESRVSFDEYGNVIWDED